MPLIPPNATATTKPAALSSPATKKPAAKREPRKPRGNINIAPLEDTPTPPTEPKPEPMVTAPRATKPRAGSLENRLGEAFASMAILPSLTGDQYSSFILASRSQKFAHDLAELAKVNPRIKRTLEGLLDGGAYGGVMFSGAAMLFPILWSYGIIPAPPVDFFGAFYPPVPAGIVPRTARVAASRSSGKGGPHPSVSGSSPGTEGAPSPLSNAPDGVVTVKPGAHPPMNPAAATQ